MTIASSPDNTKQSGDKSESHLDEANRRYRCEKHEEVPALQEGGGLRSKAARAVLYVQALRS